MGQMLARRELHRRARRHRQAEDMLGVVRHAARIAVAPHRIDFVNVAQAPVAQRLARLPPTLILVGDTFPNFVDGVLIAAAFVESTPLGIVTALAIIAHEIPQEVGDYLILLHSGYSKAKALAFNLLSSLATLVGAMLAYFALSELTSWIPSLLGLAAASMIYVAVADLIPGLHKRTELKATVQQVLLIVLGIASIALVQALVGE